MAIHDELNETARSALLAKGIDPDNADGSDILDELKRQAEAAGFRPVGPEDDMIGTSDQCQCEAWEDGTGRRVNLWVEDVQGVGLAPGGLGFDDQNDT